MTKKHSTKKALLASLLSLLLCVSMLIGTTFAWFTDSVTSGRNTIQSGNLDVVLEYWDGDSYEEVTSTTKLFNDAALWEPGYTEVAYLKVSNAGSLALKYQLAVTVYNEVLGKTEAGADIKLSDYLQFKVVESDTDLADTYTRETAQKADAIATKLQTYKSTIKALEPKNEQGNNNYYDYVALIIYMPETVDNKANHNGENVPSIEMGVSLFATQFTAEKDSFDEYYDKDAYIPEVSLPVPVDPFQTEGITITNDGLEVKIPSTTVEAIQDADASITELKLYYAPPKAEGNTLVFQTIDVLDQNGNVVDLEAIGADPVGVTISVGDAFNAGDVVVIYHDGEAVDSAIVAEDKTISYVADHFCEVVVSYGDGVMDTSAELAAALYKGGEITLTQDIVMDRSIELPVGTESVTLDLNGKRIVAGSDGYVLENVDGSTVVLKDSTGTGEMVGVVYVGAGSSVIVENGTYSAKEGGKYVFLNCGGTLTINDGTVNGGSSYPIYSYSNGHKTVIKDVTVNGIFGCISAYSKGEIVIDGGEFYMTGVKGKTSHIAYIYGDTVMTINGGTFKQIGDISMSATGGGGIGTAGNAELSIYGGTFAGDYRDLYVWAKTSKITVYGGTYAFDPTSEGAKIAEGYKKLKENGTYTVMPDGTVVDNVADFATALENGGKVIVNNDITFTNEDATIQIPAGKEVTLDLRGHTLTTDANNVGIMVDGDLTISNGVITKAPVTGTYPSFPPVPVCVNGGTVTLENVEVNVAGSTYDAAITVNSGTLNLNEGAVINVSGTAGETYGIWILAAKNNTINFNGGEVNVNADADVAVVGIFSYSPATINANSGKLSVNAGADHYGLFNMGGKITINVGSGFVLDITDGATEYYGNVTKN